MKFAILSLSLCLTFFAATSLSAATYSIQIDTADSNAGGEVDLAIRLSGASPGALAFTVKFDDSRLSLASDPKSSVNVPGGFLTTVVTSGNRIGYSIYDPLAPVGAIPDGVLATLHFNVKGDATGFAPVVIDPASSPTAALPTGDLLTWGGSQGGGVAISPAAGALVISPPLLEFGSVPVGQNVSRTAIVSNSGTAPLDITSVHAPAGSAFSISTAPALPASLAAGSSFPLIISFHAPSEGSFLDRITVEVEGGSRTIDVVATAVTDGTFALTTRSLLPAAARIDGGSPWRTSLTLFNRGELPARVVLSIPGLTSSHMIDLAPHATVRTDDLVSDYFGITSGTMAVIIDSSSPDVLGHSETYTFASGGGRVAQTVPILDWADLARSGQQLNLFGIERTDEERTNVSLMNFSSVPITLQLTVRDASGKIIGTRNYPVGADEIVSASDVFDALGINGQHDLSVSIESSTADATFFAYASTVDMKSGAPVFQRAR